MSLSINIARFDDPQHIFIIAEGSGSHCQDYEKAVALTYAAAESGADCIKWQLITPELICADIQLLFGVSPQHDAWLRDLGVTRMRELFTKGGLPRAWCRPLKALAESLGIVWLCTPFSLEEARFLVEQVQVEALKIASGDLTFTPLLAYAASTGLPVFLSTGGATIDEALTAEAVFEAHAIWQSFLIFLHCCSVYPSADEIVNLQAIHTLEEVFGGPVGFSDHTLSVDLVPALAVTQGARVYEKHLRLANDTGSIDAAHSLAPAQFRQMVDVIRRVPQILGSGRKEPHALEGHDRLWARRSPVDWLRPTEEARQGAWK